MANTTLFSSIKSLLPRTDSYNEAGGRAYKLTPKHALAQIAATGCFNGVYCEPFSHYGCHVVERRYRGPCGPGCCPRLPFLLAKTANDAISKPLH